MRLKCENGVWLQARDGENGEIFYFYSPRCLTKKCPECSKFLRQRNFLRIFNAWISSPNTNWYFLTATLRPKDHESGGDSLKVIRHVWSKARKRMARVFKHFCWVKVYERHKSGVWHTHIIISIDVHLSKKRFKSIWFASGGGYQVDVQVVSPENIGYVAKYAVKNYGTGIRNIEYSRNFPKLPKIEVEDDFVWLYLGKPTDKGLLEYIDSLISGGASVNLLTAIPTSID